jgi:hypothetical protein
MDRLKENKISISFGRKDTMDDLMKQYEQQLANYAYINDLSVFSTLPLRGSLRYINKYSKELRFGGLLVKIYEKYGNYFGMVKKVNGKIYHVGFNNNFIFYMKNSQDLLRDSLKCFISNVDKGLYTTE